MRQSTPVANPSLGHGRFIGSVAVETDTPSFAFRRMRATVPARDVPRHSHDTAYFFLVLQGRYATEAAGTTDVCGPGSVIFNPTGTTHRDHFVDGDGEFVAISIPAALERQITPAIASATVLHGPDLQSTARLIAAGLETTADDSVFLLESLGLQIIAAAIPPGNATQHEPPAWLARLREQLQGQAGQALSIAALAASAGVHPVHLARVFRQYVGCSPGEYRRRWRVEHARRQLTASSRSLAHIAFDAGYYDQSQFANAFRRMTGMSPRAYRRRFGCSRENVANRQDASSPRP
jgi:AraC family transcriptional regulator